MKYCLGPQLPLPTKSLGKMYPWDPFPDILKLNSLSLENFQLIHRNFQIKKKKRKHLIEIRIAFCFFWKIFLPPSHRLANDWRSCAGIRCWGGSARSLVAFVGVFTRQGGGEIWGSPGKTDLFFKGEEVPNFWRIPEKKGESPLNSYYN